jgi:ubiquinone/menaquinone biosynthesis C-methylase UbiE
MYTKFARYYDNCHAFKDYEAESQKLVRIIKARHPSASTLLDVACGTGKHLERLREHYQVEGIDLTPELLQIARTRLPDVSFHLGDMTDFAIGRRFDVITSLFSSIAFVKTVTNLWRTFKCFARHLNPGGLVILEPWFTPEIFWSGTITANFVNEPKLKIAWMYTSKRFDRIAILDNHFMIGTPEGVEQFTEVHELGLFTSDEYKRAFTNLGLTVEHDPVGLRKRGLFIGLSRAGNSMMEENSP